MNIDRAQIEDFFDALFRRAIAHDPGKAFLSLRSFQEANQQVFEIDAVDLYDRRRAKKALGDLAERCARAAAPVVFCPSVCVFSNSKRAAESDILAGVAISVDCDKHPERSRHILERLLGPATLVARSGGVWTDQETGGVEEKLHLHWRLNEPATGANIARLKMARAAAAELVGADPSNAPPCHPIRWPGSIHRKGEPRLVEIAAIDPAIEINLDEACELLGVGAIEARQPARPNGGGHGET